MISNLSVTADIDTLQLRDFAEKVVRFRLVN